MPQEPPIVVQVPKHGVPKPHRNRGLKVSGSGALVHSLECPADLLECPDLLADPAASVSVLLPWT